MRLKKMFGIVFSMAIVSSLISPAAKAEAEPVRFGYGGWDKGEAVIIGSEYNGTTYIMGGSTIKGRAAVPVTNMRQDGCFDVSPDDVTFFSMERESEMYTVDYYNYKSRFYPFYMLSSDGYLSFDNARKITTEQTKSNAKWWTDSWTPSFSSTEYVLVNQVDGQQDNAKIVLRIGDGDPYFVVNDSVDGSHIATRLYYECCMHKNMIHYAKVSPTCATDGYKEHYCCPDCGNTFLDADGLTYANEDLTLYAYSAIDENDDGLCDDCGKNMPVYRKVSSQDDIIAGGKYLLAAETESGSIFLGNFTREYMEEQYKKEIYEIDAIPAVELTPENATVPFMDAKNGGAMMFTLKFAAEGITLSDGGIRYGMHYAYDDSGSYALSAYGGNFNAEPAMWVKYGFRFGMNADGTVNVSSIFDEVWDGGQPGNNGIYFRAFAVDNNGQTDMFFGMKPAANYSSDPTKIKEYPLVLYRLFECGTIQNKAYRLADSAANSDYSVITDPEAVSVDALAANNVSGISEALTQDAINELVTSFYGSGDELRLSVAADIDLEAYSQSDGSMSFDIKPYIYSGSSDAKVDITDNSLRGSPMTVTLYVCDIYPQQIVHEKQDGTKEYFYPQYSSEAEAGEKTFSFDCDNDQNGYVSFDITEFSKIKILSTPEEPAPADYLISDVDSAGKTVTIESPEQGTKTLIFAHYSSAKLADAWIIDVRLSPGINSISLNDLPAPVQGDKLMLWSDLSTVVPLCAAFTVE